MDATEDMIVNQEKMDSVVTKLEDVYKIAEVWFGMLKNATVTIMKRRISLTLSVRRNCVKAKT